jgi:hypothetical protein
VCFDWVCKTICCLESSSIWSPARGSHSLEWIKPGQSTSIGSVWQLSVGMLKSCIPTRKLQDYSHSTSNMLEAPSLSPESWKGNVMDKVHILNNYVKEFTPQKENSPERWKIKSESSDLSAPVLLSIHYKYHAIVFRPVHCPNNTREDYNKVWQYRVFVPQNVVTNKVLARSAA